MQKLSSFINRVPELERLGTMNAGLVVLFGRRRIGKTALIEKWGESQQFVYSQAIEAAEGIQIDQLVADCASRLPFGIVPRSWPEFLSALSLVTDPLTVVIDEFPYLVATQPSLPSILQRWLDHQRPSHIRLVLLGSAQTMMHDIFLNPTAPLYERAGLILRLEPMSYSHFCEWAGLEPHLPINFELYSLVGGVPKYWQYLELQKSPEENAHTLFFQRSAPLEAEPERLLKDEQVFGQQAKSILESI